ncbi:RidA family protein [Gallaecimonas kandeliae]|uniref:RidA family protein n=1 Tax=Gallaecimonas kandeliae TaxID=3029055 RepID=UPI002648DEC0|nr:RidA family protein [Gallaecimonas kandeliae]WKE64625.1 RidA family protein [Gallaecimonas kandeliae]
MTIERINPSQRWSDITIYNGIAHFVEVPECEETDIESQTKAVLAQAEASLAKAGSDKSRLLSVTIYITDFADVAGLNAVWDAWFEPGTAPSRACVKVELADPAWKLEMAFVAAV